MLTADQQNYQKRLIELLTAAGSAAGETRAKLLKEAAAVVSDLRLTMPRTRDDDSPDVAGRGFTYQSIMRDVYVAAGADSALRSALRYHINNVHKARLSKATLLEYGLDARTRLEQMEDQRNALQVAAAQGRAGHRRWAGDEQLRGLAFAETMLAGLDVESLTDLTDEQRRDATEVALAIRQLVDRVIRVAGGERSNV